MMRRFQLLVVAAILLIAAFSTELEFLFYLVYLGARQLTAAVGLTSLGGHPQMVRPLLAPMVEGAAEARYGSLSRAMLALKTVLAGQDQVGTLIFDEIDANVGGRLGDVLGQKLAALGKEKQVICVTHLPQVASYAPHQWTIRKTQSSKRTVTTIQRLGDEERLEELASMLRGGTEAAT